MNAVRRARGFSTVEVIVVSSIALVMTAALATSITVFAAYSRLAADRTAAAVSMEEAAEALLVLRDLSWDEHIGSLDLDTAYALVWDGSAYALADDAPAGPYRRTVTFGDVRRNASDVVADSGTLDPNTRTATIAVYKDGSDAPLASGTMLIHNAYDN